MKSPLPFGGSRQNEKCETQSGALAFAKFFVQKNVQKAKGLGYFVFGGEKYELQYVLAKILQNKSAKQKMSLIFRSRDLGILMVFFCKKKSR